MDILTKTNYQAQRKLNVINRACLPVSKRALTPEDKEFSYKKELHGVFDHNSRLLSTVSKNYCLVPNEKILMPFIKQFGVDSLKVMYQFGNGRFLYSEFNTGRKFNFGDSDNEDIVDERLIIQNSYNKTRAFSFALGAFRWVCSNGLYSGEALIHYRKIHVGEIPVDDLVNEALSNYTVNQFSFWRALREVELTQEKETELINGFRPYEEKKENANSFYYDRNTNTQINNRIQRTAKFLIDKSESVDNQRNAWGLYNQLNRAIAGCVDGQAQVNKRILGNKEAENYLKETLAIA